MSTTQLNPAQAVALGFFDCANLAREQFGWMGHLFEAIELAALDGKDPGREILTPTHQRAQLIAGLASIGRYLANVAGAHAESDADEARSLLENGGSHG